MEYENEQESSFSEWEMLDGDTFHKEEVQKWGLEARFSEEDEEDEDSMFRHEAHCFHINCYLYTSLLMTPLYV